MINSLPAIYIAHGGGPLPILYKEKHIEMYKQFDEIRRRYPNPKAVIVFSAHWEEKQWAILDKDDPGLLYDYTAFPQPAYSYKYPAQSSQSLRQEVIKVIEKNNIKLERYQTERGYDHGVFIPLMIMYPEANIPVIQISLLQSLDPAKHFEMGVAIRELKKEGFLILGSGASSHGGFGHGDSYQQSQLFDKELSSLCLQKCSENQMLERVKNWRSLTHAEQMHPREEHLIPLFVVLGAAEGDEKERWGLRLMGLQLSNFICP